MNSKDLVPKIDAKEKLFAVQVVPAFVNVSARKVTSTVKNMVAKVCQSIFLR